MPKEGSAQWFITYPRCDLEPQSLLDRYEAMIVDYAVVRETHDDGGFHLHSYLKLNKRLTFDKACEVFSEFAKGNYQTCRSVKAVLQYISKENPPLTNIDIKSLLAKKGKRPVTSLDVNAMTSVQALDEGLINVHQMRSWNYARGQCLEPYNHGATRGVWIWGKPGCGKTFAVRSAYPDLYDKLQNKWWDGYEGQEVVLLDDYDTHMLGHFLKRWADGYPYAPEVKGGSTQARYKKFIITSNYEPSFFWQEPLLLEAITRRFKIIHKIKGQDIIV